MKRNDLALAEAETLALIDKQEYAVLCLTDPDGKPYGVPLDYVRKHNILYFHGAGKAGRLTR